MTLEEQFTKETGLKLEIAPIPVNWCEFIDRLRETVDDKIILLDAAKQVNELLTIKLTSKDALIEAQDEYIKHIESPIPKKSTSFTAYYLKREKLREKINKLKGENE
jgi:hypothetical protein